MKWKIYVPVFVLVLSVACSKDNYKTQPQFKVKSLNGNVIPLGGTLVVTIEATDKEGDLGNGSYTYLPVLLNKRRLAVTSLPYASITEPIPGFPDNSKSDIDLRLARTSLFKDLNVRPGEDKNDTIAIKIVITDRAGNKSDTSSTDPIILLGQ